MTKFLCCNSISQNGNFVGGLGAGSYAQDALLYNKGGATYRNLGAGEVTSVNDNGWAGWDTDSAGDGNFTGTAYLWDGNTSANLTTTLTSLGYSGYTARTVYGISDAGDVLVLATANTGGYYETFLLAPTLMPGDANGDGKVDINDLTIVLTNYGKTGKVWSQGDMDGNPTGTVDINDLTIVLTNYGKTYSAAMGIKAVPEPASVILLGIGAFALLAFAKQRRV